MKSFESEAPSVATLFAGNMRMSELTPLDGMTLLIQAAKVFRTNTQLDSILQASRQFWTIHPNDLDRVRGVVLALGRRATSSSAEAEAQGVIELPTEMLYPLKEFVDEYRTKVNKAKGRGL